MTLNNLILKLIELKNENPDKEDVTVRVKDHKTEYHYYISSNDIYIEDIKEDNYSVLTIEF